MAVWFIPAILTVGGLVADFLISKKIEEDSAAADEKLAQIEYWYQLLSGQMSPTEFFSEAWPSFVFIGAVLLIGFFIANPRRRYA